VLPNYSQVFYLPYRGAISHYLYPDCKSEPVLPTSLEHWRTYKSTKFDYISRLAAYLLSSDSCPKQFTNQETGDFVFPSFCPGEKEEKTDKVVIFQEFQSKARLLQSVGTQVLSVM
jgi:hypothetical protein